MNFRKLILPVVLLAGILLAGCIKCKPEESSSPCGTTPVNIDALNVQHQAKGWELYSWAYCNDWYYAILSGTDRLKTYDEVTGSKTSPAFLIKVLGKENLKAVLHKFPAGENIFWAGEGWLQKTWGTGYANLQLPPAAIVNEVQQYSTGVGLVFNVGY